MEMAKSLTIAKVSNHIPEDLAFSAVLYKLPLKSLKRFGCVSKTWSLLFQNPNFLSKFRNNLISIPHSYYNDTSLLLNQVMYHDHNNSQVYSSMHSLFGEKYENRLKLEFPNPFQEEDPFFNILCCGSITGILCLFQHHKVVLWNPTTHEFKVIPPSSAESIPPPWDPSPLLYGFGYDHVSDDYKIIRHVCYFLNTQGEDWDDLLSSSQTCYEHLWEIYSLRCNSWRKIDVDIPRDWEVSTENGLFMDGICHWYSSCTKNDDECEHILVSFDLTNEVSFATLIPLDIDANEKCNFVQRNLMMLNGSIASISWYIHTSTFHISVLAELGVKESWTKLFVVGPLPYIQYPVGAGKNGHIFFTKKDGGLVHFDLTTQMIEELGGVKGAHYYSEVIIYKENLLSIGGINH
ncbi:F-box/kelch-repeat protein At3g06240-like [Trifolium pratense]|uniref:F-box/kelch-repeat protein At3g06240-like n=1 Tax=Trifolium pratense TaxID=57577 RepID=UPI001E692FA3|nr:F-box/kelch-repeat protein At3g06240-like [Trifolium pratense]